MTEHSKKMLELGFKRERREIFSDHENCVYYVYVKGKHMVIDEDNVEKYLNAFSE